MPSLTESPASSAPRPIRRLRKREPYRLRRIPRRPPRFDPSRSNPMHADVRECLEHWRAMGYREAGVHLREKSLRRFVAWADGHGVRSVQEVTLPMLERYRRDLHLSRKPDGASLSASTRQILLVALKAFFRRLAQRDRVRDDPSAGLELPRRPVRLPVRVLTVPEVARLMRAADTATPWGIRDRAVLEVLYSTGLRRTELATLGLGDWSREAASLAVRQGKGGRDRVVPLGERASRWLGRYVSEVRPTLAPASEVSLFVTDYGAPFVRNRLGDLVRRHLEWAGIGLAGACHLLRHACATHMLENGADIRFIQMLLGHADLRSTQVYTHVSISKLRAVHAATHPAARA